VELVLLSLVILLKHGAYLGPPGSQALQAAVTSVRNARAEYGVELGRKIPASFRIQADDLRQALHQEAAVLASLAKLDPEQVCPGPPSPLPRLV
jgi:valyl-tRNA synthetase